MEIRTRTKILDMPEWLDDDDYCGIYARGTKMPRHRPCSCLSEMPRHVNNYHVH